VCVIEIRNWAKFKKRACCSLKQKYFSENDFKIETKMKLLCETNVIRRANREIKGRFVRSTLAIGKKDEKSKLCIILITASNKSGTKYGKIQLSS
jgi:hypothetical protein